MFAYWMTAANIGNFTDYVPIRTFIDGADLDQDMIAVEVGVVRSAWTVVLCDRCSGVRFQKGVVASLTGLLLFGFYGGVGWSGRRPDFKLDVGDHCLPGLGS